jgi:predicted nucleic acid-binding protein
MQKDEAVFIDVNIFMDILQKRDKWGSSLKVLNAIRTGKIIGYISPLTTAISYFLRRHELSDANARRDLRDSVKGKKILDLGAKHVLAALDDKRFNDFEDALQFHCTKDNAGTIVTRNKKHFSRISNEIEILTPEEFIKKHEI